MVDPSFSLPFSALCSEFTQGLRAGSAESIPEANPELPLPDFQPLGTPHPVPEHFWRLPLNRKRVLNKNTIFFKAGSKGKPEVHIHPVLRTILTQALTLQLRIWNAVASVFDSNGLEIDIDLVNVF